MIALSIYFDSLCIALDNSVCWYLTSYSSDPTPLLYLFFRLFNVYAYFYLLHTIPLCGVSELLKVIRDFTSLLNPWAILVIIFG